jgi:hypothetical protein
MGDIIAYNYYICIVVGERETSDCFCPFDYNTCDGGGAGKSACGGLYGRGGVRERPISVGKCFQSQEKNLGYLS